MATGRSMSGWKQGQPMTLFQAFGVAKSKVHWPKYDTTVAHPDIIVQAQQSGSGTSNGGGGNSPVPTQGTPGTNAKLGQSMAAAQPYNWTGAQWDALNNIVMAESGWRTDALNQGSGAYGIPQALPASKMASAGADWKTNPKTQIAWMLQYIQQRYGNPVAAWSFHVANGWY